MDYQNKLTTPYPELENQENSKFNVSLLKNLYSGAASELTAILQFTYQTHFFEPISGDASKAIMQIALADMEHLALLANAILFFGGDPKYVSSADMFFCAKTVNYTKSYPEMIVVDLESKKVAIKAYGDTANIVKNESLKKLLLRIQYEERMAFSVLERLLTLAIF